MLKILTICEGLKNKIKSKISNIKIWINFKFNNFRMWELRNIKLWFYNFKINFSLGISEFYNFEVIE